MKTHATLKLAACIITALAAFGSAAGAGEVPPCVPAWHPFESGGQIGMSGGVQALTVWNGSLVAGGGFSTAGGQTVNRIARWDGSAWHPFTSGGEIGVGGFGVVYALTEWNGDLIAGGDFTTAGGQTVNRIARWDGSAWHSFTAGEQIGVAFGSVHALTVWNGDLIAGGSFLTAGGQTVNRIARWDGSAWHPFTAEGQIGVSGGEIVTGVYDLTVWNGELIAGGEFTMAGGETINNIARWDASAWHPFISGGQIGVNRPVDALAVWNGFLVAAGRFTTAGGQSVNRIARWDGVSGGWHPFTSGGQIGVEHVVWALTVWNGELIAGGSFRTAGGQTVNRIARWDGSAWHPFTSGGQIGVGPNDVWSLTVWNGDLIAGGTFITAGGETVNRIAHWGCEVLCAGDIVSRLTFQPPPDGVVDAADLAYLLGEWGSNPGSLADFVTSGTSAPPPDGVVDGADLAFLLGAWGGCE